MKKKITLYEQGQIELLFLNSNHEFPLHSHESWCIGAVTEGAVLFTIDGRECLLKRGMMYVIPSNIGVSIIPQNTYKYISVCVKGDLKEKLNQLNLKDYYLKLEDVDEFLQPCYDFMWNGDENKIVEDFIELLKPLLSIETLTQRHTISPNIQIAVNYLKNHALDKFDLDKIAQEAVTSKYHLLRQFKKEMGVTPHQYYIQNKLRIAKKDILENQAEIDIATELNFADQSHLCRKFKQQMGISIQEYKRNIRKK